MQETLVVSIDTSTPGGARKGEIQAEKILLSQTRRKMPQNKGGVEEVRNKENISWDYITEGSRGHDQEESASRSVASSWSSPCPMVTTWTGEVFIIRRAIKRIMDCRNSSCSISWR